MKKIAIVLTGVIKNNIESLHLVNSIIKDLRSDFHIDVFCHCWDSNDKFTMNVDLIDEVINKELPSENHDIEGTLQEIFSPSAIIKSKFSEMYSPYYLEYLHYVEDKSHIIDFLNSASTSLSVIKNFKNMESNNKNYSIKDKIKTLQLFDSYVTFINKFSQMYAFSETLRHVKNEDNYDAVIRWRYDVVTNKEFIPNIKKMIHSMNDGICVNGAWLQHNSVKTVHDVFNKPFINTDDFNKIIYLQDLFWCVSKNYFDAISDDKFLKRYSENIVDITNIYKRTSQDIFMNSHAIFWKTLVECKVPISVNNKDAKISSFIVRNSKGLTLEDMNLEYDIFFEKYHIEKVKYANFT